MTVLKRMCALCLVAAALSLAAAPRTARAAKIYGEKEISDTARGIVEWKKASLDIAGGGALIAGLEKNAGTPAGDWYAIAAARLGMEGPYDGYVKALQNTVADLYEKGRRNAKATDIHRLCLALTAAGGDPSGAGPGKDINLIADFTYGADIADLKRQGAGGLIWALIALDSKRADTPAAALSRGNLIREILILQRADGGFALSGVYSDTDMTAMALQALAPYNNSDTVYSYTRGIDKKSLSQAAGNVIKEALARLSALQRADGGYASLGVPNAESAAQVIIALCSLGIDPGKDETFIKNGNTLMDALMLYRTPDGGFSHTLPAASANSKAGEQVLCALCSLWRFKTGMRFFYDMRPEQSTALRKTVSGLRSAIDAVTAETPERVLAGLESEYFSIPPGERAYVFNYQKLRAALEKPEDTPRPPSAANAVSKGKSAPKSSAKAEENSLQREESDGSSRADESRAAPLRNKKSGGRAPAVLAACAALAAFAVSAGFISRRKKGGAKTGASFGGGEGGL